jgi:hypothetical protein
MHGQHRRAGSRDRSDALFDSVVDVEELQVEEDALAGRYQGLAHREAVAAVKELVADLVEVDRLPEPLDEHFSFGAAIEVEGDDEGSSHGANLLGWRRGPRTFVPRAQPVLLPPLDSRRRS